LRTPAKATRPADQGPQREVVCLGRAGTHPAQTPAKTNQPRSKLDCTFEKNAGARRPARTAAAFALGEGAAPEGASGAGPRTDPEPVSTVCLGQPLHLRIGKHPVRLRAAVGERSPDAALGSGAD